jgi:hypothetical protein
VAHEPLSGYELRQEFVVYIHKCCPDDGRYQSNKQIEHFSTEEDLEMFLEKYPNSG